MQVLQHRILLGLEGVDRFEEEVDVRGGPVLEGVEDWRGLYKALSVADGREGPVVIACAVALLQVQDGSVRPGDIEPGQVVVAGRAGTQGAGMAEIEAEDERHAI
jgi:hypothetical protein